MLRLANNTTVHICTFPIFNACVCVFLRERERDWESIYLRWEKKKFLNEEWRLASRVYIGLLLVIRRTPIMGKNYNVYHEYFSLNVFTCFFLFYFMNCLLWKSEKHINYISTHHQLNTFFIWFIKYADYIT